MPVDFGRVPDEQTVVWAIQQGEGQQIEFKGTIPDARTIGRDISAFADTSGGLILIGIREHPTSIVGCEYQL